METVESDKYMIWMPEDMEFTLRVLFEVKLGGEMAFNRFAEERRMRLDELNSSIDRTQESLGHGLIDRDTWEVTEVGETFLRMAPAVVKAWCRLEGELRSALDSLSHSGPRDPLK
jgi:hypothetical protein